MVKRVRAATTGFCTRESHANLPTALPLPKRKNSRAAATHGHGDRHKTKQKKCVALHLLLVSNACFPPPVSIA